MNIILRDIILIRKKMSKNFKCSRTKMDVVDDDDEMT